MSRSVIYYTDSELDPTIARVCQEQLRKSFDGEIISISLNKPVDFGYNIVVHAQRGIPTMLTQILIGLERSEADDVFLAEHDVLYHQSHFDFEPLSPDVFYYNTNVWRWDYISDLAITYYMIRSQSGLCANRKLMIKHYTRRLDLIEERGLSGDSTTDPRWARVMGYEPGTKKIRRGGVSNEESEVWQSPFPNIDIRHSGTITKTKTSLKSFKHKPDLATWKEININQVPGWGKIKERFV